MKTMILCGGRGTRLREHSETLPKPMVAVGGHPIVWHIMRIYAHHGMSEFVLCLGYLGNEIKKHFLSFRAMNTDFTVKLGQSAGVTFHDGAMPGDGWKVTLADTGDEVMTGARIKRASRYLDGETFAVTYGDGVSDVDLKTLLEFHRSHGKLATVTGVRPPAGSASWRSTGPRSRASTRSPRSATG